MFSNFGFSDEQRQLHDAVERYLTEQYSFDRYQSINRSAAGWDPSIWRGLAELGVLAITVPAAQGGLGFGPLETLAMMGDCGRSLLLEPVLSSAVIATAVLRAFAGYAPAAQLLAGMATGEKIAVLAHFESDARFESQWVTTRARRIGDGYRLGGHKGGVMPALVAATVEYLRGRQQFGQPIGRFQALQHRVAEMLIHLEQARSMSYLAAMRCTDDNVGERRRALSAAKAVIGQAGRFVGQQAVQLHGGMGMTDELKVSHWFKRLTAAQLMFGDSDTHLQRYAALTRA